MSVEDHWEREATSALWPPPEAPVGALVEADLVIRGEWKRWSDQFRPPQTASVLVPFWCRLVSNRRL